MITDGAIPSPAPPPQPLPRSLLAPGFRFHPTDVELVLYYLKRKVSGRPLRMDAIGELDLYKREPWDLPALSRLRSGDMEWYFFSPLDRKYATRSRTNRATEQGYWKTTGKDRPVVHAGSTVGMKKTLVFHSGRAPRGQRTNWVMHEYRLGGADHLPQDAYVVCRIFQKNGAGPQNGAQYGAPFVEEEWEVEEGEEQTTLPQDGNSGLPDGGDEEYFQVTDFMENLDVGNQPENTSLFTMGGAEQIGDSQLEEPAISLEDLLNDQNLEVDGDGFIVMPEGQDMMPINDMEEMTGVDKTYCSPTQSDGYLELNDIANAENVDGLSENNFVGCPLDTCTDLVYGADESIIPPDMHDCEEFFDILNENFEDSELFQIPIDAQDDLCMQPNNPPNPMSGDDLPVLPTEDNLAFGAPSHEFRGDNFTEMNDIFSPMPNSSGYDMMDELMAFFDATDANLHYAPLDSLHKSECLDSSQQVNGGCIPTSEAFEPGLGEGAEMGSSSSTRLTPSDNKPSEKNNNVSDEPRNEGWDHSLTKHLVNMLGSISSPPALAAEIPEKAGKVYAQNSETHSTSSIHLTAGMIHIRGSTLIGKEEHWFVQKHGSVRFHLSYGMAGNATVGKLLPFDPATKVQSGVLTVVLRDWFYAFFLSALFLAASFRIGVCIYSR